MDSWCVEARRWGVETGMRDGMPWVTTAPPATASVCCGSYALRRSVLLLLVADPQVQVVRCCLRSGTNVLRAWCVWVDVGASEGGLPRSQPCVVRSCEKIFSLGLA